MAMKPNYRYERSQRDKAKAAKKEAKLAGKAAKEKPLSIERKEQREPAADESLGMAMTQRETDSFEIDVECPRCHHQAKILVGWIRTHTEMECSSCGDIIDIESKNFRWREQR